MSRRKILIPVIVFTAIIIVIIILLNISNKYNQISINKNEWNRIIESRVENMNLVLEDIKFNDYKLIIDEKNNTLYYSLVNESRNKYNPKVEYIANKSVKLAILSDEIIDEKVVSGYQFKIMIYNEKEYHIYNLKCTNFPIININYNTNEEIKQKNIPMEMYLFDNLSNIPNKITISNGEVKMDENNYIFSLHMLTPGKNKRDNKLSILNMKPNSEYILKSINNEKEKKENTNNYKVELFLNNEYKGVYILEYIDKEKMDEGNIIKSND